MEFMQEGFLIVVFILNGVGALFKKLEFIPDWLIPWILLVIGVIAGVAVHGFTFEGITQGAVAGLASVGAHQAVKQTGDM